MGGDRNKGPAFLAAALTFCALALLSVLVRLVVRIRILRSTAWDDYLIFLAMVSPIEYLTDLSSRVATLIVLSIQALSITTAVFNILTVSAGFERHAYYLSPRKLVTAIKYAILSETTICPESSFQQDFYLSVPGEYHKEIFPRQKETKISLFHNRTGLRYYCDLC